MVGIKTIYLSLRKITKGIFQYHVSSSLLFKFYSKYDIKLQHKSGIFKSYNSSSY